MSKFHELLSKEMTRRQFLVTLGVGFISLFGISTVLGALTGESSGTSEQQQPLGYGARYYGS